MTCPWPIVVAVLVVASGVGVLCGVILWDAFVEAPSQ